MARIVPFPVAATGNNDAVKAALHNMLRDLINDGEMTRQIAGRMEAFIENYTDVWFKPIFNLPLPAGLSAAETAVLLASIEKGVDQAAELVNQAISKIIVERLLLEIELYRQGRYPVDSAARDGRQAVSPGRQHRRGTAMKKR